MKTNTVRTMMLTKRNIIKMMMIVLEYSEYSSAGKASNAIWAAIYNLQLIYNYSDNVVMMSKMVKIKMPHRCLHLHNPIGLQAAKVCHPTKH